MAPPSSSSSFGGESFLQYELPNYEQREHDLTIQSIWTVIVSIVFVQVIVVNRFRSCQNGTSPKARSSSSSSSQKRKVYVVKIVNGKEVLVPMVPDQPKDVNITGNGDRRQISLTLSLFFGTTLGTVLGCIISLYIILTTSPHNVDVARGIFEAPLLTDSEVDQWMDIGAQVAYRQASTVTKDSPFFEEIMTPPTGWRKQRQPEYPLTDLQVEEDPFSDDELDWIQDKLDRRLAPLLRRIYGVPVASLRAPGQLMVRYEPGIRESVERHTDNQDLSYIILLSTNFTGGGTRYWSRMDPNQPVAHVQPSRAGQIIVTNGLLDHEGVSVESGKRFVIVGFLSVDTYREEGYSDGTRSHLPTQPSIYATWFSVNWMARHLIMFLEDLLDYSQGGIGRSRFLPVSILPRVLLSDRAMSWVEAAINFYTFQADKQARHFHAKIVSDEYVNEYLHAMDSAFDQEFRKEGASMESAQISQEYGRERLPDGRKGLANWFGFRYGNVEKMSINRNRR